MNSITFPAFNLNFKINKIACNIQKIHIYWYAIIIVLACSVSLFLCIQNAKKENINIKEMLNIIILAIPSSIVGARLYYVLFKIEYYLQNPIQIFNLREGGLAIYGGMIGAFIATLIYCHIKKIKAIGILDKIVPYLALGQAIGRWGNFVNQEAYGTETTNIFRMGIIENGIYQEVHPTFLYESIGDFIIFVILGKCSKNKKFQGKITYLYLLLYSCIRFLIEGIRIDSLWIGSFRVSQIVSVLIGIFSISILIYKNRLKC